MAVQPRVLIIESPSPRDILDVRTEGEALSSALRLASIPNDYFRPVNSQMLKECFSRIQVAVRPFTQVVPGQPAERTVFVPYFHFSAHGNDDGLGLTSGEFVLWSELRDILINFARSAGYMGSKEVALFSVTFSTCKGSNARKMFSSKGTQPCVAVVGPSHDVSWADSLTAFVTFFHQMIEKNKNAEDAVRIMNDAAGLTNVFQATRYTDVTVTS